MLELSCRSYSIVDRRGRIVRSTAECRPFYRMGCMVGGVGEAKSCNRLKHIGVGIDVGVGDGIDVGELTMLAGVAFSRGWRSSTPETTSLFSPHLEALGCTRMGWRRTRLQKYIAQPMKSPQTILRGHQTMVRVSFYCHIRRNDWIWRLSTVCLSSDRLTLVGAMRSPYSGPRNRNDGPKRRSKQRFSGHEIRRGDARRG